MEKCLHASYPDVVFILSIETNACGSLRKCSILDFSCYLPLITVKSVERGSWWAATSSPRLFFLLQS